MLTQRKIWNYKDSKLFCIFLLTCEIQSPQESENTKNEVNAICVSVKATDELTSEGLSSTFAVTDVPLNLPDRAE
jgi:hypothetical protein